MKNSYFFLCLALIFGISAKAKAQIAPSPNNLIHQWTFDDGTANDSKGTLNGTLKDNATITDKALNTANGGYVTLNGNDLAINTYSELSVEVWFTSVAGANLQYHLLYYFGDANDNGLGINYTCISPARGIDNSRAIISTGDGSYKNEVAVNGPEYDDGLLHHMVCVINTTTLTFYIDGVNMGSANLNGTKLASLGTQLAYFAKGGFSFDPTWKGRIHKISIYNIALTDENVTYLYQLGPENNSAITSSVSSLAFDADYTESSFNVTGKNLNADITITAPAGITVNPVTLPAGAASESVTVTYDGKTQVDGNLTMTSGTATTSVYLKSAGKNTDCFTPLYTDRTNLIPDPYFNDAKNFNGWKNWSLISIIDNPDSVYCGSHTGKISLPGGVEVPLTDKLIPNYTYISRAMIRTFGGAFKMGINGHDVNFSGDFTDSINTEGDWKEFVFEFNTGESLKSTTPVIFFNNDGVSGKTAFIDNWELYQKEPHAATDLKKVSDKIENIYVKDGKIVTEFDLDNSSAVELSVYNIQGILISSYKIIGMAGRNKKIVDANLASGIYIVKLTQNNESSYSKVIK